ncbi:hypothetical protein VTN02DRAFT_1243 [Thermoascus thermophilus]
MIPLRVALLTAALVLRTQREAPSEYGLVLRMDETAGSRAFQVGSAGGSSFQGARRGPDSPLTAQGLPYKTGNEYHTGPPNTPGTAPPLRPM